MADFRLNVYVANTPYHLMLSILSGCLNGDSIIYLLDKSGQLGWYSGGVGPFFNGNFRYLDISGKGAWSRLLDNNPLSISLGFSSFNDVFSELAGKEVDAIFVFNDSIPEVQTIAYNLSCGRVVYIEDGSAPYNSHKIINKKSIFFKKLFFGPVFEQVEVLGTSRLVSESKFSYPDLVRAENRIKPYSGLETVASVRCQLKAYAELFGGFLESKAERVVLYLLPPYEDKDLKKKYMEIRARCADPNVAHLVKAHPLSSPSFFELEGVKLLPSFIPTEVIPFLVNVEHLYGYATTSLMSVKYLFDSIPVTCVLTTGASRDLFFERNIDSIGVSILN